MDIQFILSDFNQSSVFGFNDAHNTLLTILELLNLLKKLINPK